MSNDDDRILDYIFQSPSSNGTLYAEGHIRRADTQSVTIDGYYTAESEAERLGMDFHAFKELQQKEAIAVSKGTFVCDVFCYVM